VHKKYESDRVSLIEYKVVCKQNALVKKIRKPFLPLWPFTLPRGLKLGYIELRLKEEMSPTFRTHGIEG